VEIARRLHRTGVTAAERRLAPEIFTMTEDVIGQLPPPRAAGSVAKQPRGCRRGRVATTRKGSREAQARLMRWISTFGHTATGHGFTFVEPLT
jgi:hypothetical protein